MERSFHRQDWPFSIRNCAIRHSFDIEHGRATCIIVKADKSVKQRIESALKYQNTEVWTDPISPAEAFGAVHIIHLIICQWPCENWRWYIRFLEEKLQGLTKGAIMTQISAAVGSSEKADLFAIHPRTQRQTGYQSPLRSDTINTKPISDKMDLTCEKKTCHSRLAGNSRYTRACHRSLDNP